MLHFGATTRLILLTGLSRRITVSCSSCQGDCKAGDLYCLTQEAYAKDDQEEACGPAGDNIQAER